jgi:hypothetical protein
MDDLNLKQFLKDVEELRRKFLECKYQKIDRIAFKKEVTKIATTNSYSLLGEGSSRIVFSVSPTLALKIDLDAPSIQTLQETKFFNAFSAKEKKYFSQIISYDKNKFGWALVEKLEIFNCENYSQFISLMKENLKISIEKTPQIFFFLKRSTAFVHVDLLQSFITNDNQFKFLSSQEFNFIITQEWLQNLVQITKKHFIDLIDLKLQNMGMRLNSDGTKDLVIIDYGFDTRKYLT